MTYNVLMGTLNPTHSLTVGALWHRFIRCTQSTPTGKWLFQNSTLKVETCSW